MNKDKFYDEQIAPKLAEIAKLCTDNGISFAACVEYDDTLAETTMFTEQATPAIGLVSNAIRAMGNIDALVFACHRSASAVGHNSVVLNMIDKLGI